MRSTFFLSLVVFLASCTLTSLPTNAATAIVASSTTPTFPPASPETSPNFNLGSRVYSIATTDQIAFINAHYQYVITPVLQDNMRQAIQEPRLILYRSIQGTWEGFNHFDWDYINAHESMFEHYQEKRIRTVWDSWLMNADDQVDPDAPDALDHWINYYAVTASQQVYQFHYDGLFMDSANHILTPRAVNGMMPDDYNDADWYRGRVDSIRLVKSYLPDKAVIFNGLHTGGGAEDSLANADGGMWETFAVLPSTGEYQGLKKWYEAIELFQNYREKNALVMIAKWRGLTEDLQRRQFVVASYLLVSHPNVIFSMVDPDEDLFTNIFYYPEYTIDLGEPLGDFEIAPDQSYAFRRFERGLVVVNPYDSQTARYPLDGEYLQAIPSGGGVVAEDGTWEGSLDFQPVSGALELPPVSAAILLTP